MLKKHCIYLAGFVALQSDYDLVDYLNELRHGCLEAYTGIIQGLKGDESAQATMNGPGNDLSIVKPHVPHIVNFIIMIAQDPDKSEDCVTSCAGLIG